MTVVYLKVLGLCEDEKEYAGLAIRIDGYNKKESYSALVSSLGSPEQFFDDYDIPLGLIHGMQFITLEEYRRDFGEQRGYYINP